MNMDRLRGQRLPARRKRDRILSHSSLQHRPCHPQPACQQRHCRCRQRRPVLDRHGTVEEGSSGRGRNKEHLNPRFYWVEGQRHNVPVWAPT